MAGACIWSWPTPTLIDQAGNATKMYKDALSCLRLLSRQFVGELGRQAYLILLTLRFLRSVNRVQRQVNKEREINSGISGM